jgi:hypothetical protein
MHSKYWCQMEASGQLHASSSFPRETCFQYVPGSNGGEYEDDLSCEILCRVLWFK